MATLETPEDGDMSIPILEKDPRDLSLIEKWRVCLEDGYRRYRQHHGDENLLSGWRQGYADAARALAVSHGLSTATHRQAQLKEEEKRGFHDRYNSDILYKEINV